MLLVFDTDISVDSGASSEFYFWTGQSRNSVNDVSDANVLQLADLS